MPIIRRLGGFHLCLFECKPEKAAQSPLGNRQSTLPIRMKHACRSPLGDRTARIPFRRQGRGAEPNFAADEVLSSKSTQEPGRQAVISGEAGLDPDRREGLWPCDFGTCLFRAETALCHLAGRGYYDSSAVRPLPSERCADRCCSCSNLVVSARNVDFWKARYRSNEQLRRLYRQEGNTSWALLASRRAKTSAAILRSHGISTGDLVIAA